MVWLAFGLDVFWWRSTNFSPFMGISIVKRNMATLPGKE